MEDDAEVIPPVEGLLSQKLNRRDTMKENVMALPKEARNLLAGGLAGMVAKSIVAPLDRIKIMYQVTSAHFRLRNVPGVASRIVKEEGFSALWKGNSATMIRVFPYSGIQFMVFHKCKTHYLNKHDRDQRIHGISPLESLMAGSFAGVVSVICTYPLDLTRAQLAVLKKKKSGGIGGQHPFVYVLTSNYKNGGVKGLFRGIFPTLLGILPYSGIAFTINEQGKRKIQNVFDRDPTNIEKIQCGALSGLFAQTLTYPLEVTRRRMQTIGLVPTCGGDAAVNALGILKMTNPDAVNHVPQNSLERKRHTPTMGLTMRRLYAEQGIRGFFKGVTMNWMKGPVAFSISFTVFDIIQDLMETDVEKSLRHR